ncbi:Ribosome-recycling factor [Enhygromyxa salina]|uniref:Ribosome-recycling factor n=1 Tax=Enhygromyxa salina TaxID=215803 RepID=A0A2S9YFH5_9BACT|nr:ribosome recycling factor [Enhygromyxa salina]PRQ03860.1 Ribosome-recycling factor [Enhygromyxa salina]
MADFDEDQVLMDAEEGMEGARDSFGTALSRVRAGRASPSLLDGVRVQAYGSQMKLRDVATVSAADARLLIVKPFDAGNISAVEKAIMNAGLGLNPSSDGVVLRVPIPPLTEERRKDLVKEVRRAAEDAKVAIRKARRTANDAFKKAEKDKELSEDALKRGLDQVQDLTDTFAKQIDTAVGQKEAEIMDD